MLYLHIDYYHLNVSVGMVTTYNRGSVDTKGSVFVVVSFCCYTFPHAVE